MKNQIETKYKDKPLRYATAYLILRSPFKPHIVYDDGDCRPLWENIGTLPKQFTLFPNGSYPILELDTFEDPAGATNLNIVVPDPHTYFLNNHQLTNQD